MTSIGTAALGLAALFLAMPLAYSRGRWLRGTTEAHGAWEWRLTLKSTLAFALAFNLIFFIQELFLVLPKAFVPGLEPTLFDNNHLWRGHHALEDLLQGTGALATAIAGVIFSGWLIRRPPMGDASRLLVSWLALLGFLSALTQVVIGTVILQNDVGRAMSYLDFSSAARLLVSIGAFIAMAFVCWRLTPYLLSAAPADTPRSTAAFRVGYCPACSPFRSSSSSGFQMPRSKCCCRPAWTQPLRPCGYRRRPGTPPRRMSPRRDPIGFCGF